MNKSLKIITRLLKDFKHLGHNYECIDILIIKFDSVIKAQLCNKQTYIDSQNYLCRRCVTKLDDIFIAR